MKLFSTAFRAGDPLPVRYTKDTGGENLSPPLAWSDLPEGTRELAVLLEDASGRAVLWLVYGIPGATESLPEGIQHSREPEEAVGGRQGRNDLGNVGFDGPLGTVGRRIRLVFRLLALDQEMDLPYGMDRDQLMPTISEHVLGEAELEATYERQREEAA